MEVDPEEAPVNNSDDMGGEPATPPVDDNTAKEPVPIEQDEAAGTAPAGGEEPGDQELGAIETGTNEVCPHVFHYLLSCSSTGLGLLVVLYMPKWWRCAHVLILPSGNL